MKTITYIGACVAMLLSLNSCIKDDSTGASDAVSKISLTTPLQDTYILNQWDVLTISPDIEQTNEQKALSYEWEIEYKMVSTEKVLSYVCKEPGNYTARLKVSNGDEIKYYTFALDVQYAYEAGLYILAQHNGNSIISYIPEEKTGKSFALDALAINNPTIDVTQEPKSIDITYDYNKNPFVYVSLGNPSTVYTLWGNRMNNVKDFSYNHEIYWVKRNPTSYPEAEWFVGRNSINFANVGKLFSMEVTHNYNNVLSTAATGGKVHLAKAMTAFRRPTGLYHHGFALFDNSEGHLIISPIDATSRMPAELFASTFSGHTLIGMGGVENQRYLALFTHNTATNQVWYHYLSPGYYPGNAANPITAATMLQSVPVTNGTIDTNSAVITAPAKNVIYYSKGNQIYGHNVLSGVNFSTTPLFTLSNSTDNIVQMYVSEDESKLYVAANAPSGSLQGSIYCYDINNSTLLWEKKNITGKINSIAYRIQ